MASNLKSEASEWEVGQSDPSEFTADAVAEVVGDENTSDEEVTRIKGADERKTVQDAVAARESADQNDKSNDGENLTDAQKEFQQKQENANPDVEAGQNAVEENSKHNADENSDDYDPFRDPDMPSSVIAEQVARELENGESPTLQAIKDAKKDSDK